MSPNNGTLLNGVLRLKLLNNPFASCSFKYVNFLLPHAALFDDKNGLPPYFLKLLNQYFLYFFFTLNNMSTCFII